MCALVVCLTSLVGQAGPLRKEALVCAAAPYQGPSIQSLSGTPEHSTSNAAALAAQPSAASGHVPIMAIAFGCLATAAVGWVQRQ